MTDEQRQAAMDAIAALIHKADPNRDLPKQGNNNQPVDAEYAKGWNKAMRKYDYNDISDDEIQQLIKDIESGKVTEIG